MRKILLWLVAIAVGFLTLALARPAMANETLAVDFASCSNLKGWYVNPDETDQRPEATEAGLNFTGKNLIHHKVDPIDFTDFDKTNKSFQATVAGKVVFKAETSGPYSTIIINADGKLWSTAFKPEAVGGQSNPVDKSEDLIGKPDSMKPGKVPYTAASRVETFGVGYWVEEGSTVVSSISFHGTKYDLTCKPVVTTPPTTKPVTHKPSASQSTTTPAGGAPNGGGSTGSGALAITGPSGGAIAALAGGLIFVGGALFWLTRRRKARFVS